MKLFIDSDILIWHLRGESRALKFFKKLRSDKTCELWTGAMQRAEVVFFMRPGEEEATLLFLSRFKTANVDQAIVDAASRIYRKWHPEYGIDVNDALLAATVLHSGGVLHTLNIKHYPMKDIAVQKAW